jgi:hypothetical protein
MHLWVLDSNICLLICANVLLGAKMRTVFALEIQYKKNFVAQGK